MRKIKGAGSRIGEGKPLDHDTDLNETCVRKGEEAGYKSLRSRHRTAKVLANPMRNPGAKMASKGTLS